MFIRIMLAFILGILSVVTTSFAEDTAKKAPVTVKQEIILPDWIPDEIKNEAIRYMEAGKILVVDNKDNLPLRADVFKRFLVSVKKFTTINTDGTAVATTITPEKKTESHVLSFPVDGLKWFKIKHPDGSSLNICLAEKGVVFIQMFPNEMKLYYASRNKDNIAIERYYLALELELLNLRQKIAARRLRDTTDRLQKDSKELEEASEKAFGG